MRTLLLTPVLLCLACVSAPPRNVVVRSGRLIDGSGGPVQNNMRLRIADGDIVAVEADSEPLEVDADTLVVDARELTVMPGMINAHAHLFSSGACTPSVGAGIGQALRNLHALKRGGITTVVDLGAPPALAVALRRHVGTARHRGPRLLVSGPVLTAPGGYPIDFLGRETVELGIVIEVPDVRAARRAVREVSMADADVVKVGLQEFGYDGADIPLFEGEPLCAVVDEAHQQELRVLAHATSNASYRAALDCGVDAIVHGGLEPLDDDIIARLVETQTPVAPTIFVFEAPLWGPKHLERLDTPEVQALLDDETMADLRDYAEQDAKGGETLPPHLQEGIPRERAERSGRDLRDNTRRMHEAGVMLGMGTDGPTCFVLHGSPVEELKRLEAIGMSKMQVLTTATHGAARILNLHDALGKLVVGYRADLIAIDGKPDENLDDVTRVRQVIIDGVVQQLDGPGLGERMAGTLRLAWAYLTD